ncbi:MAG: hypothetical protein KKD59_08910 [Acidobacteria bacterium]|nr:hypothetical protein [Acidobacteriota bacterium]
MQLKNFSSRPVRQSTPDRVTAEPTPPILFEPKGNKANDILWNKPDWEKQWESYDEPSFLRNKNNYRKTPREIR